MNDIGVIHLTNGGFAIVDSDLFAELNNYKWTRTTVGKNDAGGYAARRLPPPRRKQIYLHRVVNGTPKGFHTDHINGLKVDNRRSNLRTASASQNSMNARKHHHSKVTSMHKGVFLEKKTGKWCVQIKKNKKTIGVGRFDSERDAAIAYNGAATLLYGEFALLNEV